MDSLSAYVVDQDRMGFGDLAREWYVNRCPFVTRFWAPGSGGSNSGRELCFSVQQDPQYYSRRKAILPGFIPSPFNFLKTMQLQNLVDDMELIAFYGECWNPRTPSDSDRPGLTTFLKTNRTVRRKNALTYHLPEFVAETVGRCRAGGGNPDTLFLSSDWFIGFEVWGQTARRIPDGETGFDEPVKTFEIPLLGGVKVIEAPLLRRGTAFCLTSSEVRVRMMRDVAWVPNASPAGGPVDDDEGAWVAEFAVEVENEAHHSWLSFEGSPVFCG